MSIFAEISILVSLTVLISFIMRWLRQPLIIGYIITGLLVGPFFLDIVQQSEETLPLFSEIGIAFLLFIVGLNLTPKAIQQFGKIAFITGVGQVLFTASVGYLISLTLGFSPLSSLYIGVALAFSSTIIIMKLISDKGDTDKLYGKISIGFLLVQDLIAVIILFFIPLLSVQESGGGSIFLSFLRGIGLIALLYFGSYLILPKLNNVIARSRELLFLFSIAWGLGFAAIFQSIGFSLESGALIAGASLAVLPAHREVHSRLKPLRDFFIVLFFILLGANLVISDFQSVIWPSIILSLFVLLGNPLIMMIIMGLLGYTKKTSFKTGLTVAQISEFSLILVALGLKFGQLSQEAVSMITIVGVLTIFGSSYLITNSDKIYDRLAPYLRIFERVGARHKGLRKKAYSAILFGHDRMGYDLVGVLAGKHKELVVVDFDPDVIDRLRKKKIPVVFGDASDIEFLSTLQLEKAKFIISTVPDYKTNQLILKKSREANPKAIVIVVSHNIKTTLDMYNEGASYVIMPHFLGGSYISEIVSHYGNDLKKFDQLKNHHIEYLTKRLILGHDDLSVRKR